MVFLLDSIKEPKMHPDKLPSLDVLSIRSAIHFRFARECPHLSP